MRPFLFDGNRVFMLRNIGLWFHLCYHTQLAVSCFLLWRECQKSPLPKMTTEWKTVALFPIPSVIYLIHNNVQFATLTYVDTSTYQIMGNLKIVTTGVLFRCLVFSQFRFQNGVFDLSVSVWSFEFFILFLCRMFLGRRLSNLQWMAIVLLAVGTTTSQVSKTWSSQIWFCAFKFIFIRSYLLWFMHCFIWIMNWKFSVEELDEYLVTTFVLARVAVMEYVWIYFIGHLLMWHSRKVIFMQQICCLFLEDASLLHNFFLILSSF